MMMILIRLIMINMININSTTTVIINIIAIAFFLLLYNTNNSNTTIIIIFISPLRCARWAGMRNSVWGGRSSTIIIILITFPMWLMSVDEEFCLRWKEFHNHYHLNHLSYVIDERGWGVLQSLSSLSPLRCDRWAVRRSSAWGGRSFTPLWPHSSPPFSTVRSSWTSPSLLAVRTSSVIRYKCLKCHKVQMSQVS